MKMDVFYRPEMVAANTESYSPSASKPKLVVEDWIKRNLSIEIHSFEPATRDDIALAHDRDYVDAVLDLQLNNGFRNRDPEVAKSLPYTTGSMLAAAEHAVLHRTHTCSPTSGFHHAGHSFGGGFCTFNGLMVTALKLKADGLINTVGILDCDVHFGNGTQDIIEKLDLDWVKHYTMGRHFRDREDVGRGAVKFIDWLQDAIDDMRHCDLILYQAGADPHLLDPLGGLLGEKVMYERDCMVRSGFHRKPMAWNLAGGYQKRGNSIAPVLALHRTTAEVFTGAG